MTSLSGGIPPRHPTTNTSVAQGQLFPPTGAQHVFADQAKVISEFYVWGHHRHR